MGYAERKIMQRKNFLRLRERYKRRGMIEVNLDECGFEKNTYRKHGYSLKGQRIYGLKSGQKRPRTSLLAARLGKLFEASFLFEGTCNADIFNTWLEGMLCPLLSDEYFVTMDNAAFHKTKKTRELIEGTGAKLLFLPPYSPDFARIEKDFGCLKKIREYNAEKSLDEIVGGYQ
jgi:transposase